MSWTTKKQSFTKDYVVYHDIDVYKVIQNSAINGNGFTSLTHGYLHAFGGLSKTFDTLDLHRVDEAAVWRVTNGFHTTTLKAAKDRVALYTDGCSHPDYYFRIVHCVIPAGAKFYKNENDDYVSDAIKVVGLYSESNVDKMVEAIKEEKRWAEKTEKKNKRNKETKARITSTVKKAKNKTKAKTK